MRLQEEVGSLKNISQSFSEEAIDDLSREAAALQLAEVSVMQDVGC